MDSTYHAGKQAKRRGRLYALIIFVLAIAAISAAYAVKNFFSSNTVITQAPTVVRSVDEGSGLVAHFNEGAFSLSLPSNWKMVGHEDSPFNVYSWQVVVGKISRRLDVYVDNIPLSLGVNQVLPVESSAGSVKISGQISDNCSTFTKLPGQARNTTSVSAKWEGINFFCDLGNYDRDVTGTSSAEGPNVVTITGKATGAHKIFFAYTDNGINPDYSEFYNAIQSFRAK